MSPKEIISRLVSLEKEFKRIRKELLHTDWYNHIRPEYKESAVNLLQYLFLRKKNLSKLQIALHEKGLSSLASSESHIHRQIQETLMRMGVKITSRQKSTCTAAFAQKQLQKNSASLFGHNAKVNSIAIMVTLDSSHHLDHHTLGALMKRGMQVARINCAHDNPTIWEEMINSIKNAEKETGIACQIYMDLAGPKFRVKVCRQGEVVKKIELKEGEKILLTEGQNELLRDEKTIFCQIPGITVLLTKGNVVMMDDGMVEAIVTGKSISGIELTITRISGKPQLKTGKGINFPNTPIPIDSLTKDDITDLKFLKKHADLVGYSFVRHVDDLKHLHSHLYLNPSEKSPGLIIKIETPESVENLPYLLLFAMRYPRFGVMIARGDLAVEIGFERMSEIQEEILWICEAAHTPVIWATQVLEQLNKTGIASRSEITDAYKAAQAECIMINKGQFTHLVLDTLTNIAKRSRRHHLKKRYEMQALGIARHFSLKKL